ncbi:hypothetical protein HDV06_000919 [Boothiomyces sp. JEL0866]|nr:hypothetical protein HDV06_000919 [Boothiomyces sp. JEL0866]
MTVMKRSMNEIVVSTKKPRWQESLLPSPLSQVDYIPSVENMVVSEEVIKKNQQEFFSAKQYISQPSFQVKQIPQLQTHQYLPTSSFHYDQLSPRTPVDCYPPLLVPSPTAEKKIKCHLPTKQLATLLSKEREKLIPKDYLAIIAKKHDQRIEILNWMHYSCQKLRFIPETKYMAINLFDRYLSRTKVNLRKQVFLLAATCVYISGKMVEELADPSTADMISLSEFKFTTAEIKRMERKVTCALSWELTCVTPYSLLHELLNSLGLADPRVRPYAASNVSRTSIEVKIHPLINSILHHKEYCIERPSLLLAACLDSLDQWSFLSVFNIDLESILKLLNVKKNDYQDIKKYISRV